MSSSVGPSPLVGVRVDMAREHLAAGRPLHTRVAGASMWPLVRPGRTLTVMPCRPDDARPGDVVLVAIHDHLVLHRVLRARPSQVLVGGDACLDPDGWLPRACILGRLPRRPWDRLASRLVPGIAPWLARAAALGPRFFDRPRGQP